MKRIRELLATNEKNNWKSALLGSFRFFHLKNLKVYSMVQFLSRIVFDLYTTAEDSQGIFH